MVSISPEQPQRTQQSQAKGRRAEDVAAWYFRLNGFLSIPGFIVHLDQSNARLSRNGTLCHARTEADLMGVRFINSRERIFASRDHRDMVDDAKLTQLIIGPNKQALFILVEVKAGLCNMNGPWTSRESENMQRVIRRLGFAIDDEHVEQIASALYERGRYEDDYYVLQYICIGAEINRDVNASCPDVVQINWTDIGNFLIQRFSSFPEKMPSGHAHEQWPDFGKKFVKWFQTEKNSQFQGSISPGAIGRYVSTGSFS